MPGGDAATLVLFHGRFDSAKGWRDLPRRMRAAGHAVLTPDLPGHGSAAMVASLDAAVEQRAARMPPGPLRLLGHSPGAVLAVRLALGLGPRVERMVLSAPTGLGPRINGDFIGGILAAGRARPRAGAAGHGAAVGAGAGIRTRPVAGGTGRSRRAGWTFGAGRGPADRYCRGPGAADPPHCRPLRDRGPHPELARRGKPAARRRHPPDPRCGPSAASRCARPCAVAGCRPPHPGQKECLRLTGPRPLAACGPQPGRLCCLTLAAP
ncbi:MAG: alpha/beta fold hydrolase [Rhodobacter sp.]|nr:alpha/beta fold hydrolase [Rhodobacter sp.]